MVATAARYCPQQNLPKCRTADQRRRQDPRQRIGEPVLGVCHTDTQPWFAQGTLRKPICAGHPDADPIAISAALIFTGRIAGIVAKLPAIRRQAWPPRGRRDGNRNPIVPARVPSTRAAIDTPRLSKGAGFGHRIRPAGGERRPPARGVSICGRKSPRRIYRRGGKGVIGAVCHPAPSLVITLALRERIAAPGSRARP